MRLRQVLRVAGLEHLRMVMSSNRKHTLIYKTIAKIPGRTLQRECTVSPSLFPPMQFAAEGVPDAEEQEQGHSRCGQDNAGQNDRFSGTKVSQVHH